MADQPQTPNPTAGPEVPTPHRSRTARRLVAGLAATAVVASAAGIGAGYAVGHEAAGSATAASSGPDRVATGDGPGIEAVPGWSDPQGDVPLPADPNDGSAGGFTSPQDGSSDVTVKASASQLTGLVRIVSTMRYDQATAAGTGMVLTANGEVVTNHHVVEGSTSIRVTVMSTGRSYVAKVVGTDAKDDVAVLKLSGASGLSTVNADHDGVSVGDQVTAVGDANGTVSYLSAAKGRVLATGQSITTRSEATATGERLTGLIKISSDVISGDSGGATYDAGGEVVGMTTAASSGTSDVVGYAIPIAKVLRIADDLQSGVTSSRYDDGSSAFLGVGLGRTGTTVQGVYEGTPAATAGISAGDRITAVGSTRVRSAAQLHAAIAEHSPGDTVAVTWTDATGASHTSRLTLTEGPVA